MSLVEGQTEPSTPHGKVCLVVTTLVVTGNKCAWRLGQLRKGILGKVVVIDCLLISLTTLACYPRLYFQSLKIKKSNFLIFSSAFKW